MIETPKPQLCGKCGAPLGGRAPDALCAGCLMECALEAEDAAPAASAQPTIKLSRPDEEAPGTIIGRFKLLEKIGEGGFGTVYVAEQREPVKRRVALKIIKLGMDTRQIVARFEAERQAVAMMDHPNIAKVLDGGATETGRPYFVMELVRGMKITDYCDQNNLPARERLNLFIKACQAIQHAHQKGIIHRDIKPSNILVTVNDGVAVPKVIDFGIAKATQGELTNKTVYTQFQQFIGTPAYMSPEQAEMTSLDIDTRSDIYGLGVLLYELLTGKTPFEQKDLLKAGVDGMRRMIREQEPPRPSTRVSSLHAEERTTTAKRRGLDSPKLVSLLRGDLDWIVMKCLEKDRTRRYETANGVAMDIERYLNHEPVVAARPGTLYTFRKFARRHRIVLATTTVFTGLLLAGFTVSTWQAIRASRAEKMARTQANFLKSVLGGVNPSVAKGRDTTLLREILDKAAARAGRELANQPEVEAEMRLTIGRTYLNLGEYTNALAMIQEGLRLFKTHVGPKHITVADALNNLGVLFSEFGDLAAAEDYDRQALALKRELLGNEHSDVAVSINNLGFRLWSQGNYAGAEALHREALRIRRKVLDKDHPDIGQSLNNLAMARWTLGYFDEAGALFRQALAVFKAKPDGDQTLVATALNNVSSVLGDLGELDDADAMNREAWAMRKKFLGERHPDTAYSQNNQAILLQKQGKLDEAETFHREALALQRETLGTNSRYIPETLSSYALTLAKKGDLTAAETMQRDALAAAQRAGFKEHSAVAIALDRLAVLLAARGDIADAQTMLTNALAMTRKLSGNDHPDVIPSLYHLAWVLKQKGDSASAESLRIEATKLSLKGGNYGVRALTDSSHDLADVLQVQGKFSEAESLFVGTWEYLQGQATANRSFKRAALDRLVRFYEAWDRSAPNTGKASQAVHWRKQLDAVGVQAK
jgi:serine/threonine protein kinase/tetratricopeptide (TPR) repeat protein